MNKLPIKKLIEFRRFSERRRLTFVNKLKTPAEPKSNSDGGNYWVRSLSALSTAFKFNDNTIVKERLESLEEDFENEERKQTKVMYQRNMDILYNYEDYDFSEIRPAEELNFLSKPIHKSLIDIKGIPVQILPNHIYSYGEEEKQNIGGVWLVTWLDGFKVSDLAIYAEAIYNYLYKHYAEDYHIIPKECKVVDTSSMRIISYQQVLDGEVPSLFISTVISLKDLI